MQLSLNGRAALITGGSKGLGLAMAKAFAQAGGNVALVARGAESLLQAEAEIREAAPTAKVAAIAADIRTAQGCEQAYTGAVRALGQVDILVNNAGTSWGAPLESYPMSGWEKCMQLNVTSVFGCIQQLLPLLRKAGSEESPARVINIGSVAGITAHGENAYAYGPSKAALHQLSRMLARELVSEHINVNVIAPGRFPSKMTRHISSDAEAMAEDCAVIPMKRWGREDEMSALAVMLRSTAGAYMTGAIIPIDGGFHLE